MSSTISFSFDPYDQDYKDAEREEAELQQGVQRLRSRVEEFSREWLETYVGTNQESQLARLKAKLEAGQYLESVEDQDKKQRLFKSMVLLEFQDGVPQNEIDQKKVLGAFERALEDYNEVHALHKEAFELSHAAARNDGFRILEASILKRARLMRTFSNILYKANRNKIKGFSQTSCKVAVSIFIYQPFAKCMCSEMLAITFEGDVRYKFGSTTKDVVMALRSLNDARLAYVSSNFIIISFCFLHKF